MLLTQITPEQISKLSEQQLPDLILKLTSLENKTFRFKGCSLISFPSNTKAKDGGIDGLLQCQETNDSRWMLHPITGFQSKASKMSKAECKKEILDSNDNLSPRVKRLFLDGGEYILVTTDEYVDQAREGREEAIRKSIQETGESFSTTPKVRILDSKLLADWCNEYYPIIVYLHSITGVSIPLGFQTIGSALSNKKYRLNYFTNSKLNDITHRIKSNIQNGRISRVEGFSGLGKTRLILECLKPAIPDAEGFFDLNQRSLNESSLYMDVAGLGPPYEIIPFVTHYSSQHSGILVLDNCPIELHNRIGSLIQHSENGFKLVSINHEKTLDPQHLDTDIIEIQPSIFFDLIPDIINSAYKNILDESYIKQIVNFSEGFPGMAVGFAESKIRNPNFNLSNSIDNSLLNKFIFGHEVIVDLELKVLRVCSLFSYLEYPIIKLSKYHGPLDKKEANHVRENLLENISKDKFDEIINKYIKKEIIERRGNLIMVRPLPLALKLTIQYLESYSHDIIIEKFLGFAKVGKLMKNATNRLSQLESLSDSQSIVEKIWGTNGPFTEAEVLDTFMGSQLFRSIVHVNPEMSISVLEKYFSSRTDSQLKSLVSNRRNLVESLQKLCFRKKYFERASKLLFRLSRNENEIYGNNATNLFAKLFQLFLPATEANLKQRSDFLKLIINDVVLDDKSNILETIRSAFRVGSFNRIGGIEKQGTNTILKEYRPKEYYEIWEYWDEMVQMLNGLYRAFPNINNEISTILRKNIYGLYIHGYPSAKIEKVFELIIKLSDDHLPLFKTLESLESKLKINSEQKNLIDKYKSISSPSSFLDQFNYIVSDPIINRNFKQDHKGEWIDPNIVPVENFAEKVIENKVDLKQYLNHFFSKKHTYIFSFSKKYAELNGWDLNFYNEMISVIEKTNFVEVNLSFFFGYINGIEDNKIKDFIFNNLLELDTAENFIFDALKFCNPSIEKLKKLIKAVEESPKLAYKFSALEQGPFIESLNSKELIFICNRILEINKDTQWVVYGLLERYIYRNKEHWTDLKIFLFDIVTSNNYLTDTRDKGLYSSFYTWEKMCFEFLNDSELKEKFAISLAEQIIAFSQKENYGDNSSLDRLFSHLIEFHFKSIWSIIAPQFLSNDFRSYFTISSLLGDGISFIRNPILFKYSRNYTILFDWAKANNPIGPIRLAKIAPLGISDDNDNILWHPFTLRLIDNFGQIEGFLDQLHSNLCSFGSSGSRIPYYEIRRDLCTILKDHSLTEVKIWAQKNVIYFENEIKMERVREEERFMNW